MTGALSWRRLRALVVNLPAESATVRATVGDSAAWSTEAHLTALVVDALNVANWQRAARKGSPRPTPIQRPGMPQRGHHVGAGKGRGLSMADFDKTYAGMRDRATDWTPQEVTSGGG